MTMPRLPRHIVRVLRARPDHRRYSQAMATTTEAIVRGMRRGFEMATLPDSSRLRELSEAASSKDYTAEAWTQVGEALHEAMSQETPSRTPSST